MRNKILLAFCVAVLIGLLCVSAQRNIMMPGGFGPGVSDLQSVVAGAGAAGTGGPSEAVLFAEANQRGTHKHVFEADADVRADGAFNATPRSIVVLSGVWRLYRDPNFQRPYDMEFGPGIYPSILDYGINEIGSMKRLR
ncbi:MAG: beta/gamma crystallin-related protein [Methanothrix sp.]|uniref:beta/gamma crystallin-related protein n=1 Tax=Methanothrix sp. TaxID=90426 RepID=UPI0031618A01|nr:beta/gamma crystallin-related protein [Methanothrix sp.]